ncbi:unnamed protein product [Acidithrix sp. C25]|nr:unnamed protein product [Acidithrix sp. C25]
MESQRHIGTSRVLIPTAEIGYFTATGLFFLRNIQAIWRASFAHDHKFQIIG